MNAIDLLVQLLEIDSTNPPGNEGPAAELLEGYLSAAGLKTDILQSPGGRPNLVARLEGPTDKPALVLLSHTDVVGVEKDRWTHDPFGGDVADGFVWGRGALDMKNIAAMHAVALASLASSDATPQREVIFASVADEEAGGEQGAEWLVEEQRDAVGLGDGRPAPDVLGEGGYGLSGLLDTPVLPIVMGEKSALWLVFSATGTPGHGSMPPQDNAVENTARFVAKVAGFSAPRIHPVMREMFSRFAQTDGGRAKLFRVLASPGGTPVARTLAKRLRSAGTIGALLSDTVTPTQIQAGYKGNVVPGDAHGALDCRLLPDTDPEDFIAKLNRTGRRYGISVEARGIHSSPVSKATKTFGVLEQLSARIGEGVVVTPSLTTGTTDVRAFRRHGANGYGWAPLVLTPELLATIHGHDERVPVDGFEVAVDLMTEAVRRIATEA